MNLLTLNIDTIPLGQPLPFALRGSAGGLLAHKGFVIRNRIRGAIPTAQVKHAYIPDVYGKERRKRRPGKEGKLGVGGHAAPGAGGGAAPLSGQAIPDQYQEQ